MPFLTQAGAGDADEAQLDLGQEHSVRFGLKAAFNRGLRFLVRLSVSLPVTGSESVCNACVGCVSFRPRQTTSASLNQASQTQATATGSRGHQLCVGMLLASLIPPRPKQAP